VDSANGINGAEQAGSSWSSDDYEWLILAGADEMGIGDNYDEETPHPNPEPATIFLFGSGLIGLGVFGRKKLKRL
jgi:hypothetical protein